jgi:ribose transport system ATP-binding protein
LLILDEPTAALSGAEIATLFAVLRDLRARGTSLLYISHRLDEIGLLADRVSVLRDGQLVATLAGRDAPREQLITLMAGAATDGGATMERSSAGELVLRVSQLQVGTAVRGVSLDLLAGEIVGLGGLVGAGRTELLRAIFGADAVGSGTLALGPEEVPYAPKSTREAVAAGFAFVPEDRKQHGLFGPLSVRTNASIARLPRRGGLPGWLDAGAEATEVAGLLGDLQVRFASALPTPGSASPNSAGAISRRSSSAAGCAATCACGCSMNRRGASTRPPVAPSTRCCARGPRPARRCWWLRATTRNSPRCATA